MVGETEAMIRLYEELRKEILQSIRYQHRVILGGGATIALIYGLRLGEVFEGELKNVIVIALPPVIVVTAGLWIAEYSRMRRSGQYFIYLEDKINRQIGEPCLTWECYLHNDKATTELHRTFYQSQRAVYLGLFVVLGFFAHYLYVTTILGITPGQIWTELTAIVSSGFQWQTVASVLSGIVALKPLYIIAVFIIFLYTLKLGWPVIKHSDDSVEETIAHIRSIETRLDDKFQYHWDSDQQDEQAH